MVRHWLLLLAVIALGTAYDQRSARKSRHNDGDHNVILVVSDGLRWQEVFRGADSTILFGAPSALGDNAAELRRKYWRPTVRERREALMPFVWGTLAREGLLLGNRDLESHVDVTNEMRFSYPGYNEMLVGTPDSRIDRNDYGPNPNETVFEWLNKRREFRGRVAAFGTWDTFRDIFNERRSGIDIHTNGAKPIDIVVQWSVLPYLERERPRAVFVGFAETDDWGHEGRYDRFLEAVHAVDAYMGQLWSAAQKNPQYRGKTTLLFTADHGRGRTASDWQSHGADIPGAEETFLVMIGPSVAAKSEGRNTRNFLGEVAGATANAVGLTLGRVSCRAPVRC